MKLIKSPKKINTIRQIAYQHLEELLGEMRIE